MRNRSKALAAAAVGLVLSACNPLDPEPSYVGDGRVTTAGANQMITDNKNFEAFSDERLLAMLDPTYASAKPTGCSDTACQLEMAFQAKILGPISNLEKPK